ncbi:hypothetical protein E2C01_056949 [Portunus trituberculatus]|uniref:Uncharacterized protein n=1 Tax=Portunus trituberculatus TaxID=210409 RepID=A0A5B7GZ32_PORTR|nr:hypothetical protein [Portunus trituberculatus]
MTERAEGVGSVTCQSTCTFASVSTNGSAPCRRDLIHHPMTCRPAHDERPRLSHPTIPPGRRRHRRHRHSNPPTLPSRHLPPSALPDFTQAG